MANLRSRVRFGVVVRRVEGWKDSICGCAREKRIVLILGSLGSLGRGGR